MNKHYKLVIFDWEGTLVDTLGSILHHIAAVSENLGLGKLDENLARQSVSLGLHKALKRLFPLLSEKEYQIFLLEIQKVMLLKTQETHLIPGGLAIIQALKKQGIELAIASNKGEHSLLKAIQVTGLENYFTVIKSADQAPPKPCPQMIEEILDELNYVVADALMVGDSTADIDMAKQIHMDAIGVDFYHQNKHDLLQAGAIEVFDDYIELAKFLNLPH